MDALSDVELLAAWRAGDPEAYAVLVARHHGPVHAACVRQAAPGDADDCVQAVFLVLARRPAAAARAPVLVAWLLRVASFVCRRSRRTRGRRRRAESAAATAAAAGQTSQPSEALGHLDECLQRLPTRQRAAVAMHYLAGRSPEEVAAALGVSRDNVYQLLSRGLAGLRTLFARRGVVLSSAALASLLAGEAQAAAAAAAPSTIVAALGAPSTAVTTLAHGAMTAMTIASIAPFACAAGLILAAATTTIALTAEPAPVPAPATPAPVVKPASPAAWDAFPANSRWEGRVVTFDFQAQKLENIRDFAKEHIGEEFDFDPSLNRAITIRCRRMLLSDAMIWLAIITDARLAVHRGAVRLEPAGVTPPEPSTNITSGGPLVEKALATPINVDFRASNAMEVVDFFQKAVEANIIVHPRCHLGTQRVTLKAEHGEFTFTEVLSQIIKQLPDCRMVIRNGAIGILPKDMAPAVGSAPVAPATNF